MIRKNKVFLCAVIFFSIVDFAYCVSNNKEKITPYKQIKKSDLDQGYRPRKIGLVIGINNFKYDIWHDLRYAVKDAEDIYEVLNDKKIGDFDYLKKLTLDSETIKDNILSEIEKLSTINTNKDDTVLMYISSHGTLARNSKGYIEQYIVTNETSSVDIPGTSLSLSYLQDILKRMKSRKKVLILAACYSGSGKSNLTKELKNELAGIKSSFFVKPLHEVSEATVILSSSAWGETAREDSNLKNDIYTHYIIEALKNDYDKNEDGAVTISEVHDFAKYKTYYYTKGSQRPTAVSDILGVDPIILSGNMKKKGKPEIYAYSDRYSNVNVIVDGINKGSLPGSIIFEPGRHKIGLKRKGADSIFFEEVMDFPEGKAVSVNKLIESPKNSVSFIIGYQHFVDEAEAEKTVKPLTIFGVEYVRKRGEETRGDFIADVYFGAGAQELEINNSPNKADVIFISSGIGMLYELWNRKITLYAGPKLNAVLIQRRFKSDVDFGKNQSHFTISPGVMAGLNYSC